MKLRVDSLSELKAMSDEDQDRLERIAIMIEDGGLSEEEAFIATEPECETQGELF